MIYIILGAICTVNTIVMVLAFHKYIERTDMYDV